jgi:succinate dehydrogenase / fumarate reductase membrane anchor subunit
MMENGLRQWLIQRFTAVFLAAYTLFLFYFVLTNPNFTHEQWQWLFASHYMQVASVIALVCIAMHAWIGLGIVLTDYIKSVWFRYLLQGLVIICLSGYVVWGILILWGN